MNTPFKNTLFSQLKFTINVCLLFRIYSSCSIFFLQWGAKFQSILCHFELYFAPVTFRLLVLSQLLKTTTNPKKRSEHIFKMTWVTSTPVPKCQNLCTQTPDQHSAGPSQLGFHSKLRASGCKVTVALG